MRLRIAFLAALCSALAGCALGTSAGSGVPPSFARAMAPRSLPLTPLNAPASQFPGETVTFLTGIRGNFITATVSLSNGSSDGAVYDTSAKTWKTLQYPGASATAAYGPDVVGSGYRIVGSYKTANAAGDDGYVYDSASGAYAALDAPAGLCAPKSCNYTIAHSSYGGAVYSVVGNYDAVAKGSVEAESAYPVSGHAFLYNSASEKFLTIDVPGAASTTAYGIWIDGKTVAVAGGFTDKKGVHAYVRALGTKKAVTYDYPGAAITHFEGIAGAGGAGNYNVIGDYSALKNGSVVYGFFLQIRGWKAGTPVVIGKVTANSVYQRTVVGVFKDNGKPSGYTVGIPIIDPP